MWTLNSINKLFTLHLFLLGALSAAPFYTIQPLIDPSQPTQNFQVSFNTIGYRQVSNSDPTYLVGRVGGAPAVGTLAGGNFQYQTISPLSGRTNADLFGVLADGLAVGTSYNLPDFQSSVRLTVWNNGVASEVPISVPGDPSAVFNLFTLGVNSTGEIAGSYTSGGTTSLFRYNLYNSSFETIPFPVPISTPIPVFGLNDAGNILTQHPSGFALYNPITQSWTTIALSSSTFNPYLAENGAFAFSELLNDGSGNPKAWVAGSLVNLLNPPPTPGQSPITRNVFGYNSAGLAIGNTNNVSGFWLNGTFVNIANQIVNPQGWASFEFSSNGVYLGYIDEYGRIFGGGTYNGQQTSFVLTPVADPVPEPSTLVLSGLALASLLVLRRRK